MGTKAETVHEAATRLAEAPAGQILSWAFERFGRRIAVASSFGAEDVVLVDVARRVCPDVFVFAIDTGRLPEETYATAQALAERGVRIRWYFPRTEEVEWLETEHGLHSFRESVEARHRCCEIRKVEPLRRALAGLDAWVTGLRRDQNVTRSGLAPVEIDEANGGIVKVNPLASWTSEQVWEHIRAHRLPYNRLHDQGYPSIGCAPCTRAVRPGEHPRAGRWWWESPEHKECGLHQRPAARAAAGG